MSDQKTVEQDDADELGEEFFANAVLTRPGESIIAVVSRAFGAQNTSSDNDAAQL